tara:strand:+ start:480 stop:1055 length:576 start_codon:yes stop_codon:yes gene_type:complete
MKLYEYENYEEYVSEQTRANKLKLTNVWVQKNTMDQIKQRVSNPKAIICHGTRNAKEQQYLQEIYGDIEIIGTEISETATQFDMTIQHDFHEQKEEWVDHFDILYSNSFDHSYDPWKCIKTWGEQLKTGGWAFLEMSSHPEVNRSKSTDPLQIESINEVMDFLTHGGLEYTDEFNNQSNGFDCTIYIARKK